MDENVRGVFRVRLTAILDGVLNRNSKWRALEFGR
jgi:hypothetical protein